MLINSRVIHRFEAESRTIIEDAGDIDGIYDRTYEEYSSSQKRTVELDAEIKSKEVKSAKIRECCKKITEYESGLSEFDEQLWAPLLVALCENACITKGSKTSVNKVCPGFEQGSGESVESGKNGS